MAEHTRPQGKTEEKQKEDRGHFLQIPYYVIDTLDITDNAKMGFIRFCRLFNRKDKTVEFRGYYRRLAKALDKSPAHTIAIVDQWVASNLVQREDWSGGIILRANLTAIWERNKIHKDTQKCSNYEQQSLYNDNPSVHKINTTIQDINTAIHKINTAIQNMNEDERENAATRLLDITRLLDFFGARESSPNSTEQPTQTEEKKSDDSVSQEGAEQLSYSQGTPTTTDEEDENDSHFELPAFYAALPDAWLQEKPEIPINATPSQEKSEGVTQAVTKDPSTLFPEEQPAPRREFPNLRAGLNERDVRQVSAADQKRLDEAERREKERLAKKREQEIYRLLDKLFGSSVDRYGYNKAHVQGLSKNPLATDEIITTAFNRIANDSRTKVDPTRLTITNIANIIPGLIRSEQIKVVASQNKPESMDEREAKIRAAEKAFEEKEKAARLAAQERMTIAQ